MTFGTIKVNTQNERTLSDLNIDLPLQNICWPLPSYKIT